MVKVFVLEFTLDVEPPAPLPRFRVIVDEVSRAFEAHDDAFGGLAWARVIEGTAYGARSRGPGEIRWPSFMTEEGLIALAIRGYINAEHRIFERLPNGVEVIKLGTVKREA